MSQGPLSAVYVHVTEACNLTCAYCYFAEARARGPQLTAAELAVLWPEIRALEPGKVVITGGEPFARPDLLAVVASYRRADPDRRSRCWLNTNGTLVTPAAARALASLVDGVRVHLPVPVSSNAPPNDGQWLDAACQVVDRFRTAGLDPIAMLPVTRPVLRDLPHILQCLHRRGISRVRILVIRRTGRAHRLEEPPPSYADVAAAFDAFGGIAGPGAPTAALGGCGAGRYLSVEPDGEMYPCHVLTAPAFRLGNVRHDSLAAVCADHGPLGRLRRIDIAALSAGDAEVARRTSEAGWCLGEIYNDIAPARFAPSSGRLL